MQFPLLFAAFWSQNCCISELTSPICMPTWLLAFGFGFTWLLALASLGFWLLLGFCSPHFCVGFLFFWCTSVRRLPPPTASLHTQLCHTQLIHRHTTMALGDIDTILLCGRCGTFCDIHTVFFVAGMVPILAPFLALVAHTLADSFNHVLHVLVGLVTRWSFQNQNDEGNNDMGMGQYLLIPFLVGWTSIYQLFWCSPGVQGFDTLPHERMNEDCRANQESTLPLHLDTFQTVGSFRIVSIGAASFFVSQIWATRNL